MNLSIAICSLFGRAAFTEWQPEFLQKFCIGFERTYLALPGLWGLFRPSLWLLSKRNWPIWGQIWDLRWKGFSKEGFWVGVSGRDAKSRGKQRLRITFYHNAKYFVSLMKMKRCIKQRVKLIFMHFLNNQK